MTIKDCMLCAAEYLGKKELYDALKNNEQHEERGLFLRLAQNVLRELFSDFVPQRTNEKVWFYNGSAKLSALSKTPIDIYAVTEDGKNATFKVYYDRIEADVGSVYAMVDYSFMPSLDSESSEVPTRLSAHVIGQGIAAEYCVICNMREAEVFDFRYKEALRRAVRTRGEHRVKARVWK